MTRFHPLPALLLLILTAILLSGLHAGCGKMIIPAPASSNVSGSPTNETGPVSGPTPSPTPAPTPSSEPTPTPSPTPTPTTEAKHGLTKLFFLHHSTGSGIISGNVRSTISTYNSTHGTTFEFWDHGYNSAGLANASGTTTGINYAVPGDNTDPDGLSSLWSSAAADWTHTRDHTMASHEVIAFKSCFPASAIPDGTTLQQYKDWYNAMLSYFDAHQEKLFVVMSTPPLHRLATNAAEANNARAFANWLKSTYVSGHKNVVCFDLFDNLAKADDGTAAANMLKYEYEGSHSGSDSHPNSLANQTVGPVFAQFLITSALDY